MAITKIWPVKDNLSRVYRYISNEEKTTEEISDGLNEVLTYTTQGYKTNEKEYITGINCSPASAVRQMIHTKKSYGKDDGVLAFHAVQSFKPDELTPELCHEIGVKLAGLMWGDRFEVVVSTHLDKHHLHNHFVVNSVSFMDGKKFDNNRNDYIRFRNLSDDLCNGYNLSVVKSNGKGMHHSEWEAMQNGKPYFRELIKHDVDVVLSYARSMEQFVEGLVEMGYEVSTDRKYIAIKHPQGQRMRRLKSLLRDGRYDEEHIEERLYNNLILPMVKVQDAIPSHFYKGDSKKLKGFKALYFKYMYMMGIIHANDAPKRYPSAALRRDLIYMDKITEENTFLGKNNLERRKKMSNPMMYVVTMAVFTYLIRVLPLTLFNKPITNIYVQSFLYYVPYVTLAVMTFPNILYETNSQLAGLAALIVGIILAWKDKSLFQVSTACCLVVLTMEYII